MGAHQRVRFLVEMVYCKCISEYFVTYFMEFMHTLQIGGKEHKGKAGGRTENLGVI